MKKRGGALRSSVFLNSQAIQNAAPVPRLYIKNMVSPRQRNGMKAPIINA